MRILIPLAMMALAMPVVAHAQEPGDITVQGQRYRYHMTPMSPQSYKLEGRTIDGRWFRLSVKGHRVSGDFDGMPVYFHMPRPGRVMSHPMFSSPA